MGLYAKVYLSIVKILVHQKSARYQANLFLDGSQTWECLVSSNDLPNW